MLKLWKRLREGDEMLRVGYYDDFTTAIKQARFALYHYGEPVETNYWQAIDVSNNEQLNMWELMNYT